VPLCFVGCNFEAAQKQNFIQLDSSLLAISQSREASGSMAKFSDDSVNVSAQATATPVEVLESQQQIKTKQIADIQRLFDGTWNELAIGNASDLAVYHKEILDLVFRCLDSNSWFHKRLSAAAVSRLFQQAPTYTFSITSIDQTLERLIQQLEGKLWVGKEAFLQSIANVLNTTSHSHYFASASASFHFEHVVLLVVKQLRRPKMVFRHFVLRSLLSILDSYHKALAKTRSEAGSSPMQDDASRDNDEDDEMCKLFVMIESEINVVLAECFAITNVSDPKAKSASSSIETSGEAWKKKALPLLMEADCLDLLGSLSRFHQKLPTKTNTFFFVSLVDLIFRHFSTSVWNVQCKMLQAAKTLIHNLFGSSTAFDIESLNFEYDRLLAVSFVSLFPEMPGVAALTLEHLVVVLFSSLEISCHKDQKYSVVRQDGLSLILEMLTQWSSSSQPSSFSIVLQKTRPILEGLGGDPACLDLTKAIRSKLI
jgi:hypothetical protein